MSKLAGVVLFAAALWLGAGVFGAGVAGAKTANPMTLTQLDTQDLGTWTVHDGCVTPYQGYDNTYCGLDGVDVRLLQTTFPSGEVVLDSDAPDGWSCSIKGPVVKAGYRGPAPIIGALRKGTTFEGKHGVCIAAGGISDIDAQEPMSLTMSPDGNTLAGSWTAPLRTYDNPASVPHVSISFTRKTPGPTPTPTATPVPGCRAAVITGHVGVTVPEHTGAAGNTVAAANRPIRGARVRLDGFCGYATNGPIYALTDDDGDFMFTTAKFSDDDPSCKVTSELLHVAGGSGVDLSSGALGFRVDYHDPGAKTAHIERDILSCPGFVADFDWAQPDLGNGRPNVPNDKAGDLAYLYYSAHQMYHFFADHLGAKLPDPVEIVGYSPTSTTHYVFGLHSLEMQESDSPMSARWDEQALALECPLNCEWHELSHYMQDETFGFSNSGGANHGGFFNPNTADSIVEGWAEFWPTVLKSTLVDPSVANPRRYLGVDLEDTNVGADLRVLDKNGSWHSLEELAVAGLLWDLYDDHVDTAYIPVFDPRIKVTRMIQLQDRIAMGDQALFDLFVQKKPHTVKELYDALRAARVQDHPRAALPSPLHTYRAWGEPTGGGVFDPLDEVFLMHKFYRHRDLAWLGDQVVPADPIGPIGWTGEAADIANTGDAVRPTRNKSPLTEGAALILTVVDGAGRSLSSATVVVDERHAPPENDLDDVTRAGWSGAPVSFEPFPSDQPAQFTVWVESGDRRSDEVYTFTRDDYWAAVAAGAGEYPLALSFTVRNDGPAAGGPPKIDVPADWPAPGTLRFPMDTFWYVAAASNGMSRGAGAVLPAGTIMDDKGVVAAGATVRALDGSTAVLSSPLQLTADRP